jgi:hypothetical protein
MLHIPSEPAIAVVKYSFAFSMPVLPNISTLLFGKAVPDSIPLVYPVITGGCMLSLAFVPSKIALGLL